MEGGFDDFLSLNKQLGTLGLSLKQIPGGSKKIFGLRHISKYNHEKAMATACSGPLATNLMVKCRSTLVTGRRW